MARSCRCHTWSGNWYTAWAPGERGQARAHAAPAHLGTAPGPGGPPPPPPPQPPPALPPSAHRQQPALLVIHIDELASGGQKDLSLMPQHKRLPRRSASERAAEVRQVVHARGSARHPAGAGPELSPEGRCRLQALRPPTARRGLRRKAAAAEAWPEPAAGAGTVALRSARGRERPQTPWLSKEPQREAQSQRVAK